MELFELNNISYTYYRRFLALDSVSLSVSQGERLAIIGSNGSGKSTLLQIMAGLLHPDAGSIYFRTEPLTAATLREKNFLRFFRERVGYVFQDSDVQLFSPSVLDELLFGPLQLGLSRDEAISRVDQVLRLLEIEGIRERPSYMLSGGEKKRVAIGSVLTMNPEVLLFDEPTNGLDPRSQVFLLELIIALSEAGKTVIIATHDLSLVSELNATVAVLSEEHRIERTGPAAEILHDDDLLLRVNLIHEHKHYHDKIAHSHIHSHHPFHRH
jgi:cobalt/nickel transport system ATP-binding protein